MKDAAWVVSPSRLEQFIPQSSASRCRQRPSIPRRELPSASCSRIAKLAHVRSPILVTLSCPRLPLQGFSALFSVAALSPLNFGSVGATFGVTQNMLLHGNTVQLFVKTYRVHDCQKLLGECWQRFAAPHRAGRQDLPKGMACGCFIQFCASPVQKPQPACSGLKGGTSFWMMSYSGRLVPPGPGHAWLARKETLAGLSGRATP